MSTFLAPAVALGGQTGARVLMILVAALLADQLFRLLLRDLGFRRRYGLLAWVAVAFCYPLLPFSSQIYPELPAALLIVVALRIMFKWASSALALAAGSTAAALLVWLHVRFIPLSAGIFLGLVIAACRAHQRADAPRAAGLLGALRAAWGELVRCARVLTREWRTVTLPLAVPYVGNLALVAATLYHLYGTVEPTASYAPYWNTAAGSAGWTFWYEFALADILNPVHGWIPYVPVHWLGLAALGCLVLKWRWAAAAFIAVPVGYELLIASAGIDIGWMFPSRLLVPLIPLIAIPIALAVQEVRASRFVFFPLLAVSLAFAVASVAEHSYLYAADDKPRLSWARTTADLFPITNPGIFQFATSYVVSPGEFGPTTGRVQGGQAVAEPADGPGHLTFGPFAKLERGTYRATFRLSATAATPEWHVASVDALSAPPTVLLATKTLTAGELGRRPSDVTLEFSNPRGGLIQTRVFYEGRGTLRSGEVRVDLEGEAPAQASGQYADWPKALPWGLVTVAAGWLLVIGMRRGPRDAAAARVGRGASPPD